MWLARENDGYLTLHQVKPYREFGGWKSSAPYFMLSTPSFSCSCCNEAYKQYKDLKWEDEPVEVTLSLVDNKKNESIEALNEFRNTAEMMYNALCEHLNNATQEELDKEYEELKQYNEYGPVINPE